MRLNYDVQAWWNGARSGIAYGIPEISRTRRRLIEFRALAHARTHAAETWHSISLIERTAECRKTARADVSQPSGRRPDTTTSRHDDAPRESSSRSYVKRRCRNRATFVRRRGNRLPAADY